MIERAATPTARKRRRVPGPAAAVAGRDRAPVVLLILYLLAAIMLGGASAFASGYAFALQLLSLVALGIASFLRRDAGPLPLDIPARVLLIGFGVYVLVQLVPLPPTIWAGLSGREAAAGGLASLGAEGAWLPISLQPYRSLASVLAILPAVVVLVLLGVPKAGVVRATAMAAVGAAALSLIVGLLQVTGDRASPLYIHPFTNWGLAVGFFANANHLATFLLMSLPLGAALLHEGPGAVKPELRLLAYLTGSLLVGGAIYCTASVAGMLLWLPTLLAGAFLFIGTVGPRTLLLSSATLTVVAAAGLVAWLSGILPSMTTSLGMEKLDRLGIGGTGLEAARAYWPVGSGLGTFEQVYHLFEDPARVERSYVNHAHNDYLEWAIELGAVGVLLAAGLVAAWAYLSWKAWSAGGSLWHRAASVAVAVPLAHSIVDYPLRTPALLALFTFLWLVLGSGVKMAETPRKAG